MTSIIKSKDLPFSQLNFCYSSVVFHCNCDNRTPIDALTFCFICVGKQRLNKLLLNGQTRSGNKSNHKIRTIEVVYANQTMHSQRDKIMHITSIGGTTGRVSKVNVLFFDTDFCCSWYCYCCCLCLVVLRLWHRLGDFSLSRSRSSDGGKLCIDISTTVCNQHTNKIKRERTNRESDAEERTRKL